MMLEIIAFTILFGWLIHRDWSESRKNGSTSSYVNKNVRDSSGTRVCWR